MTTPEVASPLERRIWVVRGIRVMLDHDLAVIYGVTTKRLNEQVRRNRDRFPPEFMFTLTRNEARGVARLRSQSATLKRGQHIKHLPFAFTEHGAVMLASVLNSPAAVAASIQVVTAFVRLRALVAERDGLGRKISGLELRVHQNSKDIGTIFKVLEDLVCPEEPAKPRRIGFHP